MRLTTLVYMMLMMSAMFSGIALIYEPANLFEGMAGLALMLLSVVGTFLMVSG